MNKKYILVLTAVLILIILVLAGVVVYSNVSQKVIKVEEEQATEKVGEPLENNPGQVRVEVLE